MQCRGIESIYDQLTRGVHIPPLSLYIYICSVAVHKASMLYSQGGLYVVVGVAVFKASMLN